MRELARRSALGLVGVLLLLVALGFLTAAGWIALEQAHDALVATLVVAAVYAGLGLILLAMAAVKRAPPPPPAPPPTPASAVTTILAAFMQGFGAGIASSRTKPKGDD
nr:hypothetical protein [Pseudoruegeria sp. HB172150]